MEHDQDLQRLIELTAQLISQCDQPEHISRLSEYHTLFESVVSKYVPLVQQMATAGLFSVALARTSGDVGDYLREPCTYALFSCDRVENAGNICLYAAVAAHSEYEQPHADGVEHIDEVIQFDSSPFPTPAVEEPRVWTLEEMTGETQRAWTMEEILPFVLDDQYETIRLSENPQPDGSQAYAVTCDCQDGENEFSAELTEKFFCQLITNLVHRPDLQMAYYIERSSDYVAGEDTSPIRYHSFHRA